MFCLGYDPGLALFLSEQPADAITQDPGDDRLVAFAAGLSLFGILATGLGMWLTGAIG